ncbi:MAG TPA: alpha/beta hydrolase [Cyclobacteriaceae bacterium]|nr:alpha/beta hydrolase [Cyclobacteriaceae bacterium]HRK54108.1 alpha/beta hydrolase [Cyclobacteriaceae bacterium]
MIDILLIVAIIYVAICVSFYLFQHFAFFRPERLAPSFTFKYPFPFEELNFDMEDGGRINAIYFKVPNTRGIVFYLKGNSKSIKGWGKFSKDFLSNGYDFIMIDYRGFGKSRGKRSQKKVFNDANYIYKWLTQSYSEDKIVIYGRSLGSGIAARVASWNNPRMLILDSPYYSFYYNVNRYLFFTPLKWLLKYDMRTDLYLKTGTFPIHIIHGTNDKLITFKQSEKLKALYPEKITLHPIQDGKHNDLPDFPEFFEILYDILYLKPTNE